MQQKGQVNGAVDITGQSKTTVRETIQMTKPATKTDEATEAKQAEVKAPEKVPMERTRKQCPQCKKEGRTFLMPYRCKDTSDPTDSKVFYKCDNKTHGDRGWVLLPRDEETDTMVPSAQYAKKS